MTFETLGLHPSILKALSGMHYDAPTTVQTRAIPPAMHGKDLLVSSQTGSGKTAAFLLSDLASGITGEITYVDGGFSHVMGLNTDGVIAQKDNA